MVVTYGEGKKRRAEPNEKLGRSGAAGATEGLTESRPTTLTVERDASARTSRGGGEQELSTWPRKKITTNCKNPRQKTFEREPTMTRRKRKVLANPVVPAGAKGSGRKYARLDSSHKEPDDCKG